MIFYFVINPFTIFLLLSLNQMAALEWFKTYNKHEGVQRVAAILGITEAEAKLRILQTESKLVLLNNNNEGMRCLKNANQANTSHLDTLGNFYRRQEHRTCCGVASLGISRDVLSHSYEHSSESDIFNLLKSLNELKVKQKGMTLEVLTKACEELFSSSHVVKLQQVNSIEKLRNLLQNHFDDESITDKPRIILCNYNMKLAKQGDWWGGHISPLQHMIVLLTMC